ncbi:6,7-dimethyl-8-ribityllumazine synthase [Spirochaetota bacterium]|nr:6,7-dimethyl-8-ribityllumazine synthase [Spirochaetota bacterium]
MKEQALKILLIVSEFNIEITDGLRKGARQCLLDNRIPPEAITEMRVPGAFEIPLAVKWVLNKSRSAFPVATHSKPKAIDNNVLPYNGIITLGCVIKGETKHDDYIAAHAINRTGELSLQYEIPISLGILTTYSKEQALARSGNDKNNKGYEAAAALLKMLTLHDNISLSMLEM